MRFLTRAWHERVMSDAEAEGIGRGFIEHVERIAAVLPAGVAKLVEAGGSESLHDGNFADVRFERGRLVIVVEGYDWSTDFPLKRLRFVIRYTDATAVELSDQALIDTLEDPEAEILYCEFDVCPGGLFEHRMLLWPPRLGEIAVSFRDATVELQRDALPMWPD